MREPKRNSGGVSQNFWKDKTILVTGATGSFGRKFVEIITEDYLPKKVIVYSRDEEKQQRMRANGDLPCLRFFIGDVRDRERLRRAMNGVDYVVHAAAMKQVPTCEYNPIEAILTNVMGARNVIEAALDVGVQKVIALSTDKAVNPVNLYGATKLCAEKLFIHSNSYSAGKTLFSCVRYGNVVGSRGSIVPLLLEQKKTGKVTVTDSRMSRFWLTLEQGVAFVIKCMELMKGGEVFVPRIPSMRVVDLAKALAPRAKIEYIGIRAGEKLHEMLISPDEARQAVEMGEMFIIDGYQARWHKRPGVKPLADGFFYSSDNNDWLLTSEEMVSFVDERNEDQPLVHS